MQLAAAESRDSPWGQIFHKKTQETPARRGGIVGRLGQEYERRQQRQSSAI